MSSTDAPDTVSVQLSKFNLTANLDEFFLRAIDNGCVLYKRDYDINAFNNVHARHLIEHRKRTSVQQLPDSSGSSESDAGADTDIWSLKHLGLDAARKEPPGTATFEEPHVQPKRRKTHAPVPSLDASNTADTAPPPEHCQQPHPVLSCADIKDIPKKKRQRGGRGPNKKRTGVFRSLADGDLALAKNLSLSAKTTAEADVYINQQYDLEEHGLATKTGWHGKVFGAEAMSYLADMIRDKQIFSEVATFLPVEYNGKPVILMDCQGRTFGLRTKIIDFLLHAEQEFADAVCILLDDTLNDDMEALLAQFNIRGWHFPCILGHYRAYTKAPTLTGFHTEHNEPKITAFVNCEIIQRITAYVTRTLEVAFPGVAARFQESAKWHKSKYGIIPMFGHYWNLCINGIFKGHSRIFCAPHIDGKNIVGVCTLVVYQLPGSNFNHHRRSWLVLWNARVAVQLPPWVIFMYPSSLLEHFNVDITEFEFVTTEGDVRPTKLNSVPFHDGDGDGRGSLVYFNQATMYQSSETGFNTLTEAREQGHSGMTDYGQDIQKAFNTHGTILGMRRGPS